MVSIKKLEEIERRILYSTNGHFAASCDRAYVVAKPSNNFLLDQCTAVQHSELLHAVWDALEQRREVWELTGRVDAIVEAEVVDGHDAECEFPDILRRDLGQ